MKISDFDQLIFINKNERDYKNRKLFTDEVIKRTKFEIVELVDIINEYVAPSKLVVHCFFDPYGHVSTSRHYINEKRKEADACDFHIESGETFKSDIKLIESILDDLSLLDYVGFGIYPHWRNPGFHLDLRGYKARWGGISVKEDDGWKQRIVSFEEAFKKAK